MLDETNFLDSHYVFQKRQAGVSLVYAPETDRYTYNVYCVETQLLKEIFSVEHTQLDAALEQVNAEFGTWEVESFGQTSGCSSCSNKK